MNFLNNKTGFLFETPKSSLYKGSPKAKNIKANSKVASSVKNATDEKCKGFVDKGEGWLKAMLPIFTTTEANGGVKKSYIRNGKKCYKNEHWTDKHRRTKIQQGTVFLMLRPHSKSFSLPCILRLTRYAPKKLDKADNLPMSLKYVLDAVCAVVTGDYRPGRADSSDDIDILYDQKISSEYGVLIEMHFGKRLQPYVFPELSC